MKAKFEICKKCRWMEKRDDMPKSGILYQCYIKHTSMYRTSVYTYANKLETSLFYKKTYIASEKDGKIKELGMDIPGKCPYRLEHTIQ